MVEMITNMNALDNSMLGFRKTAPSISDKTNNIAKAEAAAEDFEAFFLTKMMESMFDGVSTNGAFGGGEAEKIYRSMLLDEYGKEMAKLGNVGVKDQVMRTILEMQEMASNGYVEA